MRHSTAYLACKSGHAYVRTCRYAYAINSSRNYVGYGSPRSFYDNYDELSPKSSMSCAVKSIRSDGATFLCTHIAVGIIQHHLPHAVRGNAHTHMYTHTHTQLSRQPGCSVTLPLPHKMWYVETLLAVHDCSTQLRPTTSSSCTRSS